MSLCRVYKYIKKIYIKDTQRTVDINTHKVSYKYSFFSLSRHSSFIAFIYRLHLPFLSFKSVASLESSHTSMWHSKGPYKRCFCVWQKNVPSNHFLSERRGCERKRGQKKEDWNSGVCVFFAMFNQILLRAAFSKRSVCLKETAFERCSWPCFLTYVSMWCADVWAQTGRKRGVVWLCSHFKLYHIIFCIYQSVEYFGTACFWLPQSRIQSWLLTLVCIFM